MRQHQRGFDLLEVLVTLTILAIGLLGIAGLQLLAHRNSLEPVHRARAVHAAEYLLQQLRLNPAQRVAYLAARDRPLLAGSGPNPEPDCESPRGCAPPALARYDRWRLQKLLAGPGLTSDGSAVGGLPQAAACVLGPPDGGAGLYTVEISWRGVGPAGATQGRDCGGTTLNRAPGANPRRGIHLTTWLDAP